MGCGLWFCSKLLVINCAVIISVLVVGLWIQKLQIIILKFSMGLWIISGILIEILLVK